MAVALLGRLLYVALLVSSSSAQVPVNVAVGKTATQSSTFNGTDTYVTPPLTYRASADLAVDGAPTKNYTDKTCAITEWHNGRSCTDNPWWQVDLGGLYDVFNVTIYQRQGALNRGPLVVRVGGHVERPENRTRYIDRPMIPVLLSPPVTASTVNISIIGCEILQLCEVEVFSIRHVNECDSNPCQHGGSCIDGILNHTCHCMPGYTGVNCERDVNECLSNPCQHGNCTDGVSSYTCVCVPGYTGVNCETDINECESSPCQNGASCQNLLNKFKCDCLAGYNGTTCEININCASSPCRNGATCRDNVNSYNCMCTAGFTGRHCEEDIDECGSSPCSHNSLCVDGVNNYTCYCAPGYTGLNCLKPCSGGTYGPGCSVACSAHCPETSDRGGQHCDRTTGQCLLQTGCKDGFQGLQCDTKQQSCLSSSAVSACTDRLAEGVGIGLGVGLGTALLLAFGLYALLRCRRRRNSLDERGSAGNIQLSPRQMQEATRRQEMTPGQEHGFYESLDDASKGQGRSGPYAELGEARVGQDTDNPYSHVSA